MLFRTLTLSAILSLTVPVIGQVSGKQMVDHTNQPVCQPGTCTAAASLPSVPTHGKWEVQDFKQTNDSISCAVVKYDPTLALPTLHLLCPGPDIFAPLRVHLALTWRDVSEVPSAMKSMLVDTSRSVKFKSKPGDSRAELTFHNFQRTQSRTQWISFTAVNVGLVLPQK